MFHLKNLARKGLKVCERGLNTAAVVEIIN